MITRAARTLARPTSSEPFPTTTFRPPPREVLYRDELKYIHSSDGRHELYDLAIDPAEESNLLDVSPELGPGWIERIAAARPAADPDRTRAEPTETEPLSPEELEQLRALGYIE